MGASGKCRPLLNWDYSSCCCSRMASGASAWLRVQFSPSSLSASFSQVSQGEILEHRVGAVEVALASTPGAF
jgi:hypothetical protein